MESGPVVAHDEAYTPIKQKNSSSKASNPSNLFILPQNNPVMMYYKNFLSQKREAFNTAQIFFMKSGIMEVQKPGMIEKEKVNLTFANNFSVVFNLIIKILSQDFAIILLKWKHSKTILIKGINEFLITKNFTFQYNKVLHILGAYKSLFITENYYNGILKYLEDTVKPLFEQQTDPDAMKFCIEELTKTINTVMSDKISLSSVRNSVDLLDHFIYDRSLFVNIYFSLYELNDFTKFDNFIITNEEEYFKIKKAIVDHYTRIYQEIWSNNFNAKEFVIEISTVTQAFLNKLFYNIKVRNNIAYYLQRENVRITHYQILSNLFFTLETLSITLSEQQKTYIIKLWYETLKVLKCTTKNTSKSSQKNTTRGSTVQDNSSQDSIGKPASIVKASKKKAKSPLSTEEINPETEDANPGIEEAGQIEGANLETQNDVNEQLNNNE